MESNILVPKKIKVGFNDRNDTYTKKLAYVIYYDERGKLRKETSWESWRDKNIDPQEFDNEPVSGFVLNKKVGGQTWGWNPRQTYCRVYDPRGFEFEITVPNLLWILENTNSIKGKGLEGDFVYGWSGKELLLVPVESPDYKEIKAFSDGLLSPNRIGVRDLIVGATYKFSTGDEYVYLGRFPEYENNKYLGGVMKDKNNFYFYNTEYLGKDKKHQRYSTREYWSIKTWKSLPKIAQCIDDQSHSQYAELMDLLEEEPRCKSPQQYEIEKIPYIFEEFRKHVADNIQMSSSQHRSMSITVVSEKLKDCTLGLLYGYLSENHSLEKLLNGDFFYTHHSGYKELGLKDFFDMVKPIKVKLRKKNPSGETTNA